MPLDGIAGGLLGGLFRFLIYVFVDIFFEAIIKRTGHIVLVTLRPKKEPSEGACVLVGLVAWAALLAIAILVSREIYR